MEDSLAASIVEYCRRRFHAQVHSLDLSSGQQVILRHESTGRWYGVLADEEHLSLHCGKLLVYQMSGCFGFSRPLKQSPEEWIVVHLDGSVPEETIRQLLLASFRYTDLPDASELSYLNENEREEDHAVNIALEESRARSLKEQVRITDGYEEQAIHWKKPPVKKQLPDVLQKLKAVRLSRLTMNWDQRMAEEFCLQALVAKDYEDDYPFHGRFVCYRPTYRLMDDRQLRGYFTWRTMFHQGRKSDLDEETLDSFAFVRVYEILNGLVDDKEEGLLELMEIHDAYGEGSLVLKPQLEHWIHDYIICYGLQSHATELYFPEIRMDRNLLALEHPMETADADFLNALAELADYRLLESQFAAKNPELAAVLLKRICIALDHAVQDKEQRSLASKCFGDGGSVRQYTTLFRNAVYFDSRKNEDKEKTVFTVDAIRSYERDEQGCWLLKSPYVLRQKSKVLGELLREADRQMRLHYGKSGRLKEKNPPCAYKDVIAKAIDDYEKELAEARRPKVHIDMSSLSRIREDAAVTRDALIVDEAENVLAENQEAQTVQSEAMELQPDMEVKKEAPVQENTEEVQDLQKYLLQALLDGREYKDVLQKNHVQLSMLVDQINETMMDVVGDTVIEFDGETPSLIEDYVDDVRNWLEENKG
ncbi:MAG: TerB N-terminal domain-containing protein [Bulleidia sp.]|nr:TerB N-terminal domain-containing protein [Bulleidia sp.]